MKRTIIIAFLAIMTKITFGQGVQMQGAVKTTVKNKGYFVSDSGLVAFTVGDTVHPTWLQTQYKTGATRLKFGIPYYYSGTKWNVFGDIFDSTSLSNRINERVKYTDTSSMLNPYLRKVDTSSLSNRINLKLNISDTTAMLGNYAYKNGSNSIGTWGINITGNATTVTTNANLTGVITSIGNATSIASQTGTGTTFAMSASPSFTGTVDVAGFKMATGAGVGKVLTSDGAGVGTWAVAGASTTSLKTSGALSGTLQTVTDNAGSPASTALQVSTNRIGILQDASVSTQASSVIQAVGAGANINMVLNPKGTGAIVANIPDGSSGGIARGSYVVDLQTQRGNGNHVASGAYSVISGGNSNTASGLFSGVGGGGYNVSSNNYTWSCGSSNTASGNASISAGGTSNTASGSNSVILGGTNGIASGYYSSVIGGVNNKASSDYSLATGYGGVSSITNQFSIGGPYLGNVQGTSQTSIIPIGSIITGTGIAELLTYGSGRLVLSSDRIWNAQIQIVSTVVTKGNALPALNVGNSYVSNYIVGIKNIAGTCSLIGSVQTVGTPQFDTPMSTSVVTISADNTNKSLKIEFTPPSPSGTTTVIRCVATIILAEVAY